MNLLRSYLSYGTTDSAMRLGFIISIINGSIVVIVTSFIVIYSVLQEKDLNALSTLILSLSTFGASVITPLAIGKGIQSYSENKFSQNNNTGTTTNQASQL